MNIIMRKYIYGLMMCIVALAFTACDETSQDNSFVTHYVVLELNGDEFIEHNIGTPFTDPGVVATEGTEDVSDKVTVSGKVDVNTPGIYTLTYSAVNKDGFSSSITRRVGVFDPTVTTDISGIYSVGSGSYRYYSSSDTTTPYSGDYEIEVSLVLPGLFYISDLFGGYYESYRGYASSYGFGYYNMEGYLKLNSDNTIESISGSVYAWGDSYDTVENGVYDPEAGTITFDTYYAKSMFFHVILTK
jgi:hypothetical protein